MREIEVLRVGAEGGTISMMATERDDGTWWFAVTTDESSLPELCPDADLEGLPLVRQSPWVEGWEAALARLDRYPWARLSPMRLHPEFRERVLAAVPSRRGHSSEWERVR